MSRSQQNFRYSVVDGSLIGLGAVEEERGAVGRLNPARLLEAKRRGWRWCQMVGEE